MSDNLKKFTEENRDSFEVYDFDVEEGWQELNKQIGPIDHSRKLQIWQSIAAAVSVLLVASLGYIFLQRSTADQLPMDLVETQQYYQQQIDQKVALVKHMAGSEILMADLERLDVAFEELKADLKDDVHNEAVVTAMIDNYRLKLSILEEILQELEEQENESSSSI